MQAATKSIEFSAPMALAVLKREKDMTRRMMRPQPVLVGKLWRWKDTAWCEGRALVSDKAPVDYAKYQVDDLVWVKEPLKNCAGVAGYVADDTLVDELGGKYSISWRPMDWRWKLSRLPARFCPREASRLTLRITERRCERVQDITEGDAVREGFMYSGRGDDWGRPDAFTTIWDKLHGRGAWDRNDWVWVYGFEVVS